MTDRYFELVRTFPLRPLQKEADLAGAIKMIDSLIDQDSLTESERDYLDVLSDLVEAYEQESDPVPYSDVEVLKMILESKGVTQTQFASDAGIAESTISEVLAGKRKLTRRQIGKICRSTGWSVAVFRF